MVLARTDPDNNPVDFATGFINEPGRFDGFVGQGTVALEPGRLTLTEPGDAVTLAVRFWPQGNTLAQGIAALNQPQQILGMQGEDSASSSSGWSVRVDDPTSNAPRLVLRQHSSGFEETLTSFAFGFEPVMLVFVLENIADRVLISVFVDGAPFGGFTTQIIPSQLDLDTLTFGDIMRSDGSISQVAIWRRELTQTEIASIGGNVNCPDLEIDPSDEDDDGGDPESENPLIDSSGRSTLNPTYTVDLSRRSSVLSTEPGRIDRRRMNQYSPRRYRLQWDQIPASELSMLRAAFRASRTAGFIRWNHPRDDVPSTPALARRWRIVGGISIQRLAGGSLGTVSITLEEVE